MAVQYTILAPMRDITPAGAKIHLEGVKPPATSTSRLANGRSVDEYFAPIASDHFVPRAGDQILDIGIIGAGIAGLSAAIALTQSGHNVKVFEKSTFANEIGAAINMCPNACRVLEFYEFDFQRPRPVTVDELRFTDGKTLKLLKSAMTPDYSRIYGQPWLLYHRVDLHNELKRTATEPRPHTSNIASIELSAEVSDIDLDGHITFGDGRRVKKDVIIVADGIRTRFATKVVDTTENLKAMPTGTVCYRFVIPTEKLRQDSRTSHLFQDEHFVLHIAPADRSRLVWYPCRGGDLQNFGFFIPDWLGGFEEEVWNISASQEEFMKSAASLHPDLQVVCEQAEDLKLWRLCSREKPLESLAKDNVVLIGDAAHPMLPHQGQGGGMAVEDGAALGVLLSHIKSRDEIPARLQLFQQLRIDRVSAMIVFSSVGQDESAKIAEAAKPYVKGPVPRTPEEFHVHNFTPNIVRDALELLEKHKVKEGR